MENLERERAGYWCYEEETGENEGMFNWRGRVEGNIEEEVWRRDT